jgi:FkbM family methyltransferase
MPLNLFHRCKNAVNWLISPLGFAVQRVPKRQWHLPNSIIPVKVGNFSIEVPGINPVYSYYESNPGLFGQLGLLTTLVRKKYPQLAVVDIGANVGDTACLIKTAEDVPVLCIEGDDTSFAFLQKNLVQFRNAIAHKLFLAEKSDIISASLDCAGWNTTIVPGTTGASRPVQVKRFDEFIISQPDWQNYKLLKIDTEGFDCPIIRGAVQFIRQVQPVMLVEYNRKGMKLINEPGIDTLFQLADLGYSRIVFHDSSGQFIGSCTLADRETVLDWHHYADKEASDFRYLDLTLFHECDTDIALEFLQAERKRSRCPGA